MIIKPAISFLMLVSDSLLIVMIRAIIIAMTGNHNYATPEPTLLAISEALDNFISALANAADGGKVLTEIKNAKRKVLTVLVRQLAAYVSVACQSDMAILLSSGFPVQKPNRHPFGILPPPATPTVAQGKKSGDLYAVTEAVPGGYIYTWQLFLASAPTVPVRTEQSTGARHTFTSLIRGETYRLQVNVVGTAGPSDFSQTVELTVL